MTPEEYQREIEAINYKIMATVVTQIYNLSFHAWSRIGDALLKALTIHNDSVVNKLYDAAIELKTVVDIMDDPEIQALVQPVNEGKIKI